MSNVTMTLTWIQFFSVIEENSSFFENQVGINSTYQYIVDSLIGSDGNLSEEAFSSSFLPEFYGSLDALIDWVNDAIDGSGVTASITGVEIELAALASYAEGYGIGADELDTYKILSDYISSDQTLVGENSNNVLNDSFNNDLIKGKKGNDIIDGGDVIDKILGGKGTDTINGGNERNYIKGEKGDDLIHGGDGSDLIYEQKNNDIVYRNVYKFTSNSCTA